MKFPKATRVDFWFYSKSEVDMWREALRKRLEEIIEDYNQIREECLDSAGLSSSIRFLDKAAEKAKVAREVLEWLKQ